jgi:hypothetical protein
MSNKMILPPITMYIKYRQKKCLDDEKLKYEMNEDCVFISEKITVINIVSTVRLCVKIMIFAYFLGAYWYIFAKLTSDYYLNAQEENELIDTFI